MNDKLLLKKLQNFVNVKSQRRAAKELGISPQYLNDILLERRSVSCPPILKKFGFRKLTVITKKAP